jgi:hypothetical protein
VSPALVQLFVDNRAAAATVRNAEPGAIWTYNHADWYEILENATGTVG